MNNINTSNLIDTKENKNLNEQVVINYLNRITNPFAILSVQDVARDLKIGENMAYTIFKRSDFPSVNIGRCWKITLVSYLLWKTQKRT